MPAKPNFEEVKLFGDVVRVGGRSDEVDDIVDIRVVLVQQEQMAPARIAGGGVEKVTTLWQAALPSADFRAGPAVAFGVETRRENFTTTTWTEQVTIIE